MARITVEDCLENVENRFELVMVATKRARQLAFEGAEPLVPWSNDKATVVALREIATGKLAHLKAEKQVAEQVQITENDEIKATIENASVMLPMESVKKISPPTSSDVSLCSSDPLDPSTSSE